MAFFLTTPHIMSNHISDSFIEFYDQKTYNMSKKKIEQNFSKSQNLKNQKIFSKGPKNEFGQEKNPNL